MKRVLRLQERLIGGALQMIRSWQGHCAYGVSSTANCST